jgi:hypothetical protein
MVERNEEETTTCSAGSRIRTRKNGGRSCSNLHRREVMLIQRLLVWGWSDERIWKEYRIPISTIQKAKKIERQATEEFENKESNAVELARFKEQLKSIIDSMGAIAKDKNVSLADRIKSEAVKLEALTMLRVALESSITSPDPYGALEKIVEQNSPRVGHSGQ